jgi:hypothetical protein
MASSAPRCIASVHAWSLLPSDGTLLFLAVPPCAPWCCLRLDAHRAKVIGRGDTGRLRQAWVVSWRQSQKRRQCPRRRGLGQKARVGCAQEAHIVPAATASRLPSCPCACARLSCAPVWGVLPCVVVPSLRAVTAEHGHDRRTSRRGRGARARTSPAPSPSRCGSV